MATRRALLAGITGVAGVAAAAALPAMTARALDPVDTKGYFDQIDGTALKVTSNNEASQCWTWAYWMKSYLTMYEAYGPTATGTHYLDRFVAHADAMLAQRDSVRGVTDFRGLSGNVWRNTSPVGFVTLRGPGGEPLLEVRTASRTPRPATCDVTVAAGSEPATFRLTVQNRLGTTITEVVDNLTLDPADSARYAVQVLHDRFPLYQGTSLWVTGRDLRTVRDPADLPVAGTTPVANPSYVWALDSGLLAFPLARFARLVGATPALAAGYGAKAAAYLQAAQDAVLFHEGEYVTVGAGGLYVYAADAPVYFDGQAMPTNQKDAVAGAAAEIARATGDPFWGDRAYRLSVTTRSQFTFGTTPTGSPSVTWPYHNTNSGCYTGYAKSANPADAVSQYVPWYGGNQIAEDLGHAELTLTAAATTLQGGFGYTGSDLQAAANQLTEVLVVGSGSGIGSYPRVDGSGTFNDPGQRHSPGFWLPIAPWDHTVASRVREHFLQHSIGSSPLGTANLVWAMQRWGI